MKDFETNIIKYLQTHSGSDLYVLSDFYDFCCGLLDLDINQSIKNYKQYSAKIRYRLNKMVKQGILEKSRIGTGFLGKTDFGFSSINVYSLSENYKI